jgi:hypothetical protein
MGRRRGRRGPAAAVVHATRRGVRGLALLALTGVLVVGGATPVLADPAGPTNFRSSLEAVTFVDTGGSSDAGSPDVDVEVVGGDAYLVVRNRGREVLVPGYEGEPYLRFASDGRVWVNDRSPARWLNDARFGAADVEVPAAASADAEPAWRLAATGGEWSWHDHRIHFMSPVLPPQVDTSRSVAQPVLEWEVPFEVDGRLAQATGTLEWVPGPSPVVPVGLLALAAVGAGLLAWRGSSAIVAATAVIGALTLAVGAAATWSMPAGADVEPALLVLPGVALAVLIGARLWRQQGGARAAALAVGAGIPVGIWGMTQIGALTRPIVPGPLPTSVVAPVTAAALAVGVAAVIGLARSALHATRVDVD